MLQLLFKSRQWDVHSNWRFLRNRVFWWAFPNFWCCSERWFRLNRISHPDWVKMFGDPNGQIKLRPKQKYEVLSATDLRGQKGLVLTSQTITWPMVTWLSEALPMNNKKGRQLRFVPDILFCSLFGTYWRSFWQSFDYWSCDILRSEFYLFFLLQTPVEEDPSLLSPAFQAACVYKLSEKITPEKNISF